MADLAIIWIQFVLLFIRYPRKNALCAIFVLYTLCFIPTFALPDNYYANLEFSKLEKQHPKRRSTQLDRFDELPDHMKELRGSFSSVGAVKDAEGRIHWVYM